MTPAVHVQVLLAAAIWCSALLYAGRWLQRRGRARLMEFSLGTCSLIGWIIANAYGFLPRVFTWGSSLPLHVCDIIALIACMVMMQARPAAPLRAALYFAGIGLCTQAFLTPALVEGPDDPQFWFFWHGHFVILSFALYDLVVRCWQPRWPDWRIAVFWSALYVAFVFALDIIFDLNYGFVGPRAQPNSIIEHLGPWPWRVAIMVVSVLCAYTAMMLPWHIWQSRSARRSGYDSTA